MLTREWIAGAIREYRIDDGEYPVAWKELPDAPKKIYAIGDISLLAGRRLAVVGSRRTPVNALKVGGEIVKELSQAFTIVTGLADGGDTAAAEGALAGGKAPVCLVAGGFFSLPQYNQALLEQVAKRGLLLSPYPADAPTRVFSYEYRNKLLAKLCDGVFVLGAGEKSGALITARYAEGYKKPVFALPYPPNSASGCGCNALIKRGGALTERAEDIFSFYGIERKEEKREISLSPEEELLYGALKNKIEAHASELAAATGIPVFKLRGTLSALEVKGLIASLGGNRYSIV